LKAFCLVIVIMSLVGCSTVSTGQKNQMDTALNPAAGAATAGAKSGSTLSRGITAGTFTIATAIGAVAAAAIAITSGGTADPTAIHTTTSHH
jgi:hypothetical protein